MVGYRQGSYRSAALATAAQDRAEEAAALLAAASRICNAHDELDLPGLADALASLRSTLGDEAFEVAWQSGWVMAIDQVMDQIAAQTHSLTPRLAPLR
jgi:hypothetical protein